MFAEFDNIFIWAQVVGLVAMCFSITAWQMKKPEHILAIQIPNSILWCLQYLLLASPVAALSNFLCIFKDFGVIRAKEEYLKYIIATFIVFNFVVLLLFYQSAFSVLPFIVSLLVNIPLLKKNNRHWMARGTLTAQFCWIIYNIHVGAYMGIITALLVSASSVIGMYRYENWNLKQPPTELIKTIFLIPILPKQESANV